MFKSSIVLSLAGVMLFAGLCLALDPDDPALVGLWLCDEGKGDVVKDSSGNGNDGRFNGPFDWTDGKFGKAVLCKGSGSIDVDVSDSLNSITDALTIAGWFRVDGPSDTGPRRNEAYLLEDQSNSEPVPDGWSFRIWTDRGLSSGFYGTTELEQGQWYHIAGVYDGETMKLYIDGVPEPKALTDKGADWDAKWSGKIQTPGNPLQLKYGPESYTGAMDEIILFSRALSDDEIKQLTKGWASVLGLEPGANMLPITWARMKIR